MRINTVQQANIHHCKSFKFEFDGGLSACILNLLRHNYG